MLQYPFPIFEFVRTNDLIFSWKVLCRNRSILRMTLVWCNCNDVLMSGMTLKQSWLTDELQPYDEQYFDVILGSRPRWELKSSIKTKIYLQRIDLKIPSESKNRSATEHKASRGHGKNQSNAVQLINAGNFLHLTLNASPTGLIHKTTWRFVRTFEIKKSFIARRSSGLIPFDVRKANKQNFD